MDIEKLLIKDLVERNLDYSISKWVLERIPYVFNSNNEQYIEWKEKLSKLIGVDSKAIVLTGSASVGYSLNPEKNMKKFDESSDIDVAIISSYYFDISWFFLRNLGTKRYSYSQREKNSIEDHKKRLIYWGTIATDKIIQILPFGHEWISAIDCMSKEEPTVGREINFRIYKDFEALKAYQKESLKLIKDKLITK